jgi:peptidoglycan/LPS O-acetylase OafA/YrhL
MHAFEVYWTPAVEEQFYFFWPVILLLVPGRNHKSLVIGCIVGCVILRYIAVHSGVTSIFIYTMLPTHADGLLVGALIAIFVHERKGLSALDNSTSGILFFSIAAFFFASTFQLFGLRLYYDAWNTRGAMFYYLVIAVAYGCLLYLSIMKGNPVQRLFKNRALRKAGIYSYCLYLTHQIVAHLLNWSYSVTGVESTLLRQQPLFRDIAHLVPLFVISFGIAAISWRFIEQPILSLKRYLSYREARPDSDIASAL